MAMSALHYGILRDMHAHGVLPRGGALLELGEANWYGDLRPNELVADVERLVADPARRAALVDRLLRAADRADLAGSFEVAKVVYDMFFEPCEVQAVDFEGTPAAERLDLNRPLALNRRFDVVVNHGTAEHIFNVAQVFRTAHDYTAPGGLMIHESPFTGWIDHGFYNLQPTLFFDVADANRYQVVVMLIEDLQAARVVQVRSREAVPELAAAGRIPNNAVLFTVLGKDNVDRPFQVPMQGYYRNALSPSAQTAWKELR